MSTHSLHLDSHNKSLLQWCMRWRISGPLDLRLLSLPAVVCTPVQSTGTLLYRATLTLMYSSLAIYCLVYDSDSHRTLAYSTNTTSAPHQPLAGLKYSHSFKLGLIPVSQERWTMLGIRLSTVGVVIRFL